MPSLFRFLVTIAVLVGIVYGAMLALIAFVEPRQREMIQVIPASRFNK